MTTLNWFCLDCENFLSHWFLIFQLMKLQDIRGGKMVECSKTVLDAIELGMEEEDQHARILEDQLYDVKNRGELVWGD